jgi:hypothetical protein
MQVVSFLGWQKRKIFSRHEPKFLSKYKSGRFYGLLEHASILFPSNFEDFLVFPKVESTEIKVKLE